MERDATYGCGDVEPFFWSDSRFVTGVPGGCVEGVGAVSADAGRDVSAGGSGFCDDSVAGRVMTVPPLSGR
jgi:hypothetical protein